MFAGHDIATYIFLHNSITVTRIVEPILKEPSLVYLFINTFYNHDY